MNMNLYLMIFAFFCGIYLLVAAFRKKGRIFEKNDVKEGRQEQFFKIMRLLCFVMGVVFLAYTGFSIWYIIECSAYIADVSTAFKVLWISYLPSELYNAIMSACAPTLATVSTVLWYCALGGAAGMFIFSLLMTDRKKKEELKKAAQAPAPTKSTKDPRFDFDDDEPVIIPDKPFDPRFDFDEPGEKKNNGESDKA